MSSGHPIRILQIVHQLHPGDGVAVVLKNWYSHIDTARVQFDFLIWMRNSDEAFMEEIRSKGANIFFIPEPQKHPVQFLKESFRFFKDHHYRTIHSHVTHLNFLFYPLVKMFGIKNIIQHAHTAKWGITRKSVVRNYLLVHAVWPLITHKFACSAAAGKAFYGKNFRIVKNGIDTGKFAYNPQVRVRKRKELGLENAFVIGHVGRFSPEKNHKFVLDVFEAVAAKEPRARLILIGSGPLEQKIKDSAAQKGLRDKVIFLGRRKDVNEWYQAFDTFVFPSLQEGFGLVALEAQTAGLPCILADTLPKEVLVCNYQVLPLKEAQQWADKIIDLKKGFKRCNGEQAIEKAGLSSQTIAADMQDFYLTLEG